MGTQHTPIDNIIQVSSTVQMPDRLSDDVQQGSRLPNGSQAEYYSTSAGGVWIPCVVQNFCNGCYVLDVNPVADPSKVRPKAATPVIQPLQPQMQQQSPQLQPARLPNGSLPNGSQAEYYSASAGGVWIPCVVQSFCNGYYVLDVHPMADPSKVRLKADTPIIQPLHPQMPQNDPQFQLMAACNLSTPRKVTSDEPSSARRQTIVSSLNAPRRVSSFAPVPAEQPALVSNVNGPQTLLSASSQSAVSEQLPLKLVIFDFDCTLTFYHLFDSLAGLASTKITLPVPPPHARSELGQLLRLSELDADSTWGPAGLALEAFGGATRVAQLRNVLKSLVDEGVECIICSKGMVGPIRKCLEQVGLLTFFKHVFGNVGSFHGSADYDNKMEHSVDPSTVQHYLGSADMDVSGSGVASKSERIAKCVKDRGLKFSQVAYLDDQIDEIKLAANVCRTVQVRGANVCAAIRSLMPSS